MQTAREHAHELVAPARDHPTRRVALMRSLYEGAPGRPELQLPYRRAALAFMGWQVRRGLLNPLDDETPGSRWWRAVNERLLMDTAQARAHVMGCPGPISSPTVALAVEFARRPSTRRWYRAHNAIVAAAYLDNRARAESESHAERFFLNLILARVLFAHALVAAPRLALGWLRPAGPLLGDPRLTITGIFVSLSRVLPDQYPLTRDPSWYIANERGFGHILDLGIIQPRLQELYAWSAVELAMPELCALVHDGVPTYAWDRDDVEPWNPPPRTLARAARRLVPAPRRLPR